MALVITAFIMVVSLSVAAIMRLETETSSEQFSQIKANRNVHFAD